ncbi:cystinosin-like [Chironomus tepperi]|uniref:cystinosin-like n=1 Tax=Chironomus tepperi TaxID=113505 RepID=UPI00391FB7E2
MNTILRLIIVSFLIILKFDLIKNEKLPSFEVVSAPDVLIVGEKCQILLKFGCPLNQSVAVNFIESQEGILNLSPKSISIPPNSTSSNFTISLSAIKAGSVEVTGYSSPKDVINDFNLYFKVTVANSHNLIIASLIVGWGYFLAWGICSYPQVWLNFKRKSVVGLSFDFLALNIVGHVSYTIFNLCFYFGDFIQAEYFLRYPHGQSPVLLNDVLNTSHAAIVYIAIIAQCCVYQCGKQSISNITWMLLGTFMGIIVAVLIFCAVGALHWLDFLYTLSYIKLAVTLTKYVPQAVLNYRRKSTVGWSIERVLLDMIGGVLSIMQMLINAYNYDDWQSYFGNPAKLCLGLFSICFDIIFIIQHYCLYRNSEESDKEDSQNTEVTIKQ